MAALIKEITIRLDWEVVYSEWAPLGPCPSPAFTPPTGGSYRAVHLGTYL